MHLPTPPLTPEQLQTINIQFTFNKNWVIYADEHIIVANKPSGLLSVPGRGVEKQECLLSHLQVDFPHCRIVHRLDMATSGLIVLAQTTEAHRNLSYQFQERQTTKTYHAICAGKPSQKSGQICLPMRCDWERRPRQIVDFTWGKHAQTYWQVLQQYTDRFLVELTPITGRSHQLRVHMQTLGHPILGDNLYADHRALEMAPRLLLHAKTLGFTHPETKEYLQFDCESQFSHFTNQNPQTS